MPENRFRAALLLLAAPFALAGCMQADPTLGLIPRAPIGPASGDQYVAAFEPAGGRASQRAYSAPARGNGGGGTRVRSGGSVGSGSAGRITAAPTAPVGQAPLAPLSASATASGGYATASAGGSGIYGEPDAGGAAMAGTGPGAGGTQNAAAGAGGGYGGGAYGYGGAGPGAMAGGAGMAGGAPGAGVYGGGAQGPAGVGAGAGVYGAAPAAGGGAVYAAAPAGAGALSPGAAAGGGAPGGGQPGLSRQVQFLPIVGAPPETVGQVAAALARNAPGANVAIVAASAGVAPVRLKGYLSTMVENDQLSVVYVWDVLDASGERVSRIQGQEPAGPAVGGDPWRGVGPQTLEAIARRTLAEAASLG